MILRRGIFVGVSGINRIHEHDRVDAAVVEVNGELDMAARRVEHDSRLRSRILRITTAKRPSVGLTPASSATRTQPEPIAQGTLAGMYSSPTDCGVRIRSSSRNMPLPTVYACRGAPIPGVLDFVREGLRFQPDERQAEVLGVAG